MALFFIYSITISASSGSLTDGKLSSNGTEINLCPFSMMRICSIDSLISVLAGANCTSSAKIFAKGNDAQNFSCIGLLLFNRRVRWPTAETIHDMIIGCHGAFYERMPVNLFNRFNWASAVPCVACWFLGNGINYRVNIRGSKSGSSP